MVQISKQGSSAATLAGALPLDLFKALCDPSRLAVLVELAACKPPCTVGRIAECCPTDVSVVSRHLAMLRSAGVVEAHRSGKEVHYELSTSRLAETLRSIADAIETCCPDSTANGCCGTKTQLANPSDSLAASRDPRMGSRSLDHPARAERRKS
jgi:ArsR family transcriptional regulator